MMRNSLQTVERLAKRVAQGEVVFFIGSGFSIDSEGNTAKRLMRRLLIRLSALRSVLCHRCPDVQVILSRLESPSTIPESQRNLARLASLVDRVCERLKDTFNLKADGEAEFPWSIDNASHEPDSDLTILAREYYAANDWFCGAFEQMLDLLYEICKVGDDLDDAKCQSILDQVAMREENIREAAGRQLDATPLAKIPVKYVRWAGRTRGARNHDAGKALFLDTMGFADEAVMGGRPTAADRNEVERSYNGRLFPRHHVLARFAREGFCPIVLTTNYDLLLDGAWRLAGFEYAGVAAERSHSQTPDVPLRRMARIGAPLEFVKSGRAIGTSLVVKVHGCAELYRQERELQSDGWRRYLDSMVFTYREIQNWRDDSWARDFLTTLQRTRTVVFIGYSLQDPVIHDTFRTVYEEIARHRTDAGSERPSPSDAPSFFFAPGDDRSLSFHGVEVLNAATYAVGATPTHVDEHDNYVRFFRRDRQSPANGRFPSLDDLFRWMFHVAVRERQRLCLDHQLRSVASAFMNRRLPQSEIDLLRSSFSTLLEHERNAVQDAASKSPCVARRTLQRITAWTHDFHPALLREMACCDLMQSFGPGLTVDHVRRSPWYYPLAANLEWAAWCVVVELSLRNLLRVAGGGVTPDKEIHRDLYPTPGSLPTVVFRRRYASASGKQSERGLESLAIRMGAFDAFADPPMLTSGIGRYVIWTLPLRQWHVRSPNADPNQLPLGGVGLTAPSAQDIWKLAQRPAVDGDVGRWLDGREP